MLAIAHLVPLLFAIQLKQCKFCVGGGIFSTFPVIEGSTSLIGLELGRNPEKMPTFAALAYRPF